MPKIWVNRFDYTRTSHWSKNVNDVLHTKRLFILYWVLQYMTPAVKSNESGFGLLLCTFRLNWARRTSWGWWDEWDDTALQTQDSKSRPCQSEAEHDTFRWWRFPIILILYEWAEKKHFVSLKLDCQSRVWTRDLRLSKQAALTTAPWTPPWGVGLIISTWI